MRKTISFKGYDYFDDRLFVLQVAEVIVRSADGPSRHRWAVITRRNVPGYPPFRTDEFGSRDEAICYLHATAPTTPRISPGGSSPTPTPSLSEFKNWLASSGLEPLPEYSAVISAVPASRGKPERAREMTMSNFHGIPQKQKLWLVRKFLDERIKKSLLLRWLGSIQSMSDFQVMGTPEGTAVTIVESFHIMRGRGIPDHAIFSAIEEHRASMAQGRVPRNVDLTQYVKYRICLEHKTGQQLTDSQASMVVTITENFINDFCRRHTSESTNQSSTSDTEDSSFISELPDPKSSKPLVKFNINSGQATILYYEYPRTIGDAAVESQVLFKYPQLAVVCNATRPLVIIRVEESTFGTAILSAVKANGDRHNFGPFARTTRDAFMERVQELARLTN